MKFLYKTNIILYGFRNSLIYPTFESYLTNVEVVVGYARTVNITVQRDHIVAPTPARKTKHQIVLLVRDIFSWLAFEIPLMLVCLQKFSKVSKTTFLVLFLFIVFFTHSKRRQSLPTLNRD